MPVSTPARSERTAGCKVARTAERVLGGIGATAEQAVWHGGSGRYPR